MATQLDSGAGTNAGKQVDMKAYGKERKGGVTSYETLQGYLAHEKHPPPQDHHTSLGIGLL